MLLKILTFTAASLMSVLALSPQMAGNSVYIPNVIIVIKSITKTHFLIYLMQCSKTKHASRDFPMTSYQLTCRSTSCKLKHIILYSIKIIVLSFNHMYFDKGAPFVVNQRFPWERERERFYTYTLKNHHKILKAKEIIVTFFWS